MDGSSNPGAKDIAAGSLYGLWCYGASFRLMAVNTTSGITGLEHILIEG
jgi:hypothetical protein